MILGLMLLAAASPTAAAEPARHAALTRAAVRTADYPRSVGRAGIGGTTRLRFRVSERGRVDQCAVVASSGAAALDAQACRIVQRWRFRPARDAARRPVPESWGVAFTWRPPDHIQLDPPFPLTAGSGGD